MTKRMQALWPLALGIAAVAAVWATKDRPAQQPVATQQEAPAAMPEPVESIRNLRRMTLEGLTLEELARGAATGAESLAALPELVASGRHAEAAARLEEALKARQEDSDALDWTLMAELRRLAGDLPAAQAAAQRAVERSQGSAFATYQSLRQLRACGGAGTEGRGEPLGVVMEVGYPAGLLCVVGWNDGNASLYLGTGGGVIGGVAHDDVRQSAAALSGRAAARLEMFEPVQEFPMPSLGEVRFHILTTAGAYGLTAPEVDLGGSHPLRELHAACQRLASRLGAIAARGADGTLPSPGFETGTDEN